MNLRFFIALSVFITVCNAYKVLVLGPMNGKSHFLYVSSFVRALLGRGHEVTYLTSNSLSKPNLANYSEILIDPPIDLFKEISQSELIETSSGSVFYSIFLMTLLPKMMNEYAFENPNVQKFIKSTAHHFDVIVAEEFLSDSFLMFSHKFKAPVVTICPIGVIEYIDRQQGLLSSPSFVPHYMLPFTDNMSFIERWYNTIVTVFDWIVRNLIYLPSEKALANKYFAHLGPLPDLNDIARNVSVNLVNIHRAIFPARPSMPNVIPIGGAHIKPAKPLPNDLKRFIDEAEHGVIYVSLGTILKTSELPVGLTDAFLDTFKNLKQRVLWKFDNESRTDLSPNVMVRKWMPQNDILAHPNVVLFISHGGLFGTTESLYHGVPMLLIPFFGDQFRNAHRITLAGYGEFISHRDITTESFSKALNGILSDESYLKKARQTSEVFKDNLINPMDEAMFWIEHVAKFKGAKHMKSHAVNMSWFSYLLLDVLLVNILGGVLLILVLRSLIKKLFGKKKTEKIPEKKN